MSDVKPISVAAYHELTGFSKSTIHRRIASGEIPIYQPGGRRKRVLVYPPRPPMTPTIENFDDHTDTQPLRGAATQTEQSQSSSAVVRLQSPRRGPRPTWMKKPTAELGSVAVAMRAAGES